MPEFTGEQEVKTNTRDQVLSKIDNLLKIENPEQREQESSKFIDERLESLTRNSSPKEISLFSPAYKGFIHPESTIVRSFLVDPFCVDDKEIYVSLLDSFAEFKRLPNWQEKSLREIVSSAVIRAIGNYFGNYWDTNTSDSENKSFYMNHIASDSTKISLNEFKGKRFAVCAEKAAVAQNLLSFLGYDVELIASTKCKFSSSDQDRDGHMYNLVSNESSHLIFDPANPSMVEDKDGNAVSFIAAGNKISEEDYQKLRTGGQVEVVHYEFKRLENGDIIKGSENKVTYGGPSQPR
jgi:hypothetical protein